MGFKPQTDLLFLTVKVTSTLGSGPFVFVEWYVDANGQAMVAIQDRQAGKVDVTQISVCWHAIIS